MDKQLLADTIQVLEDLHACDNPDCREDNCLHVLPRLRALLAGNHLPGIGNMVLPTKAAPSEELVQPEHLGRDLLALPTDSRNWVLALCTEIDRLRAQLASERGKHKGECQHCGECEKTTGEFKGCPALDNYRPAPDATVLREAVDEIDDDLVEALGEWVGINLDTASVVGGPESLLPVYHARQKLAALMRSEPQKEPK